jgi:hypothetical protein
VFVILSPCRVTTVCSLQSESHVIFYIAVGYFSSLEVNYVIIHSCTMHETWLFR